ncbi:MAG: hypothetical protein JST92_06130 [Deltaproteobacteria bacterium]|nr:hypothetical protein [Deltaproteobacteria bacterium]
MKMEGAIAAALVDYESGVAVETAGGSADFDVGLAAAGNTEVVRAKLKVASLLGLAGGIEDMLITLSSQYHLIRPLTSNAGFFLYVALDRAQANLAMARHKVMQIESALVL